jgi:hypothetical protein
MYQPKKPFWQMNIPELQEYVNQFKKDTKKKEKKKFSYRKRFTIKKRKYKGKRLKLKLRMTRKNIDLTYG